MFLQLRYSYNFHTDNPLKIYENIIILNDIINQINYKISYRGILERMDIFLARNRTSLGIARYIRTLYILSYIATMQFFVHRNKIDD